MGNWQRIAPGRYKFVVDGTTTKWVHRTRSGRYRSVWIDADDKMHESLFTYSMLAQAKEDAESRS